MKKTQFQPFLSGVNCHMKVSCATGLVHELLGSNANAWVHHGVQLQQHFVLSQCRECYLLAKVHLSLFDASVYFCRWTVISTT